ncbi:Pr6Pr family membrane protein [Gracilibacillus oryzae]|uniref:Pr6Pr family membrane protein n=1 Tax=Gracilibacillus oryzae TaxID=1672701 RepID=UPI001885EA68
MAICFLTYHFLLSSGGEYAGVRVITNFTLHYLILVFVFINWIIFEVKKSYTCKFIFLWMIYPILYCVISCLRGLFDGYYPYFFFNPNGEIPAGVGSYTNVALFIAAFLIVYLILSSLLILLNRLFLHKKMNSSSEHDVRDTKLL